MSVEQAKPNIEPRDLLRPGVTRQIAHDVPLNEVRRGHVLFTELDNMIIRMLRSGGSMGGRTETQRYERHFGPELGRRFSKIELPILARELGFTAPQGFLYTAGQSEEEVKANVHSLTADINADPATVRIHEKPRTGYGQARLHDTTGVDETVAYLLATPEDLIVQEYIPHGPLENVARLRRESGLDINKAARFIHFVNYDAAGNPQINNMAFHYVEPRPQDIVTDEDMLPRGFKDLNDIILDGEPAGFVLQKRLKQGAIAVTANPDHYALIRQVGERFVAAIEGRYGVRLPLISFDVLLTPATQQALESGDIDQVQRTMYFIEPQPIPDFFGIVYNEKGEVIHQRGAALGEMIRKTFYGQNEFPIAGTVFARK